MSVGLRDHGSVFWVANFEVVMDHLAQRYANAGSAETLDLEVHIQHRRFF
jgi:hypothetical protein